MDPIVNTQFFLNLILFKQSNIRNSSSLLNEGLIANNDRVTYSPAKL